MRCSRRGDARRLGAAGRVGRPRVGRRAGAVRVARGDRGSTTAEFAIALPGVLLVLLAALAAVQLGALQVLAQDAAADAARDLARGESRGTALAHVGRLPDLRLDSWRSGGLVCARVSTAPAGVVGLARIRVAGESCALADGG